MMNPELQLDKDAFLARHWQREHLLIRDAIPGFTPPLDPDQLAGLAMESPVESRIIEHRENEWKLHHGPFHEKDFRRDVPWTLLVQAVDHYLPEVAALRKLVDFIPQWRVDDVMVSYAVDGGSVGPHYDNYDVFLLQGSGEREWLVGQFCDDSTPLQPNPDLRIIDDFQCQARYTLLAGDILYIPPGTAHWGVARGECTTFSIGFRAPRVNTMVARFVDHLLEQLDGDQFYRDLRPSPATRPGEIRPADLEKVQAQLQGALDQATGNHWFGELVTEPRYEPQVDEDGLAEAGALLRRGVTRIELSPSAKLAWQQEAEGVTVFANGESRVFPLAVLPQLETLCGEWCLQEEDLTSAGLSAELTSLLGYLLQSGCIYVE